MSLTNHSHFTPFRGSRSIIMRQAKPFLWLLLVVSVLTMTACGQPAGAIQQGSTLEGTITVSGAWALYPLMVRWGEEFHQLNPAVNIDISAGGAGKGMADALAGAVDIGMVSRKIYPAEIDQGAFWISVTKDAVFPTTSARNPVWIDLRQQGISRNMLVGIFVTGEISNWGQVAGRPEISDPIHVYTRSDACGAAATWAEYLGVKQEDLLGVGIYGDPGLLDAVIKDPLGIGFNNLNFAFDFDTGETVAGATVIPLDVSDNGQANPEELTFTKKAAVSAVATGHYPSPPARDLHLVSGTKPSGLVKTFLEWVLTDGQAYVDEAGYVALPSDKLNQELSKLD